MNEQQAHALAEEVLAGMGMERLWHKNVIRFGEGTLDTFHAPMVPERTLKVDDIFYVDLGAVWDGHEGDAGDTFAVGSDAEMAACAQAARSLWSEVAAQWKAARVSGEALYGFARQRAAEMGWLFNWEVRGHRLSDFPHAIYKAGKLGDFSAVPATSLWVLEIQIAHPSRPFGAFYEDLLTADGAVQVNRP
jgi:Xaa-Pro aminopeptidase